MPMSTARNPLSNAEAIAAMPGLEVLAEVMAPHIKKSDPAAMAVRIGTVAAFGSHAAVDSLYQTTDLWEVQRASAARVGRDLPLKPPTADQFDQMRRSGEEMLGSAVADQLPAATYPIAALLPLLTQGVEPTLDCPARSHTVYCDGTKPKPLSDVHKDPVTKRFRGSRSKAIDGSGRFIGIESPTVQGPRVSTDVNGDRSIPFCLAGLHGGDHWLQLVLGLSLFEDFDEPRAAIALFERTHDVFGDGIHAFIYDKAFTGEGIAAVMARGVVPLVDMKAANKTGVFVNLDGFLSTQCGRKDQPHPRAQYKSVQLVEHKVYRDGELRDCPHHLWALDGALIAHDSELGKPTVDGVFVVQRGLRREWLGGRYSMFGEYTVPCRYGSFPFELELTAPRPGSSDLDRSWADKIRPISDAGGQARSGSADRTWCAGWRGRPRRSRW
jgi:hypothetical protein